MWRQNPHAIKMINLNLWNSGPPKKHVKSQMKFQKFKFELLNFWVSFNLKEKIQILNFQKFKFELLNFGV